MYRAVLLSMYQQNRYADVIRLCDAQKHDISKDVMSLELYGLSHLAVGAYDKALPILEAAAKKEPGNVDYSHNLALCYKNMGNSKAATKILLKIIKRNKAYAVAYNTLGSIYSEQGKRKEAVASFKKALAQSPDYLDARYNLAKEYFAQKKYSQALRAIQPVVNSQHLDDSFKQLLVDIHIKLDDPEAAEVCCAHTPESLYAIAQYYESHSRLDDALRMIEQCIAITGASDKISYLHAVVLRRKGDLDAALEAAKHADEKSLPDEYKIRLYYEFGRIYDKKKDYSRAFECYAQANKLNAEYSADIYDQGRALLDYIKQASKRLSDNDKRLEHFADNSNPMVVDRPSPLFMVAFPRSGTTLLDQIVDAHSSFSVMEEYPLINDVINEAVRITKRGYPDLLEDISAKQLEKLRRYYFKLVDSQFEYDRSTVLVDKLPLNIIEIRLIQRLFPSSKIILSLRHPYDVCLSNFMQHYDPNAAMVHFNSLQGCVDMYAAVMELWTSYTQHYKDLRFHTVKYERLVEDMRKELENLFDFLGVEWQESVMSFNVHALGRKSLSTPSYQQVTQPLYQSSKYRWRHYKGFIFPVFSKLDRFVDKFGYEVYAPQ